MKTKFILAAIAGTSFAQTTTDDGGDDGLGGLDSITACLSIIQGIPTPADDLLSYLGNNDQSDICDISDFSVPASLTSAFSSYVSAEQSWFSENSAALSSACPAGNEPSTFVPSGCTSTGSGSESSTSTSSGEESSSTESSDESSTESSGESSTTSGTSGPTATGGGASSTTKSAGAMAARETGVAIAAVAAAAGFALAAL